MGVDGRLVRNIQFGSSDRSCRVGLRAPDRVNRGGSWSRCGHGPAFGQPHQPDPSSRTTASASVSVSSSSPADVASPEMSILGDANITQLQGVAWVDPGVEAHDVRDGNLTSSVSVSGRWM